MKTESPLQFTETAMLFDWGFENFQILNISDNEKNYTIQNSSFYDTDSTIFGNTDSMTQINKNGEIILPNTASFSDAKSELNYTNDGSNSFATLSYTYAGKEVGSTTIELTNLNIPDFNFNNNSKDTKTDTKSLNNTEKKVVVFTKTQIVITIIIIVVLLFLLLAFIYLFRNYHFFRRRRIRKNRKLSRKLNDFDFK